MKKITTLLLCIMLVQYYTANAQSLAINTTGTAAHASAMLDVTSINKGLLIPRLTTAQRTAIALPGKGLLVYDSTLKYFYFHNGIVWQQIITDSNNLWRKNGTGIYNANAGNVGIGTTTAQSLLQVKGGAVLFDSSIGSTPVSGAGTRMMWIPAKRAFRVGEVIGSEWDDFNIGTNSIAMGFSTTASGYSSTAMGNSTYAVGDYSTAIGIGSQANAHNSIAMGFFVSTGGERSTAMGDLTNAIGITSTAMGSFTSAIGNFSTAMGSGTSASGTTSTAMGSETSASGTTSTAIGSETSASGTISTAMGNSTHAIGDYSTAMGNGSLASAHNSIAMGFFVSASGERSTAMGDLTNAIGITSTAMGAGTSASGTTSTAMGNGTNASGTTSTAMGSGTSASGTTSTAMGNGTTSKSFGGFVAGLFNDATNAASSTTINPLNRIFQIGNGTADNARSNAFTVLQNGNIGIGELSPTVPLNFTATLGNKIALWGTGANHFGMGIQPSLLQIYTDISNSDIAFGHGNSAAFTERMRIEGTGNVGIGTPAPTAKLSVNGGANNTTGAWGIFSDERIKTIVDDFTDGLNVIRQIQPVNFVYNDKAPFKSDDAQIGIVAQDLEKIAPYMVSQQSYQQFNDLREVNNQAYTFLLINAVKEQQVQIESQQKENREQKNRIDNLEKLVNELARKIK